MKTISAPLITDEQSLVSAKSRFGHSIPVYDDGFGQLFIHRDSMGISGIVRAQSWGDAYEICEDEFFPEADETVDELISDYGFIRKHIKIIHPLTAGGSIDMSIERPDSIEDYKPGQLRDGQFVRWETIETPAPDEWMSNELFQEAFGFRPNGARSGGRDKHGHGIYAKDLNGDRLDSLTPELLAELEITLQIEDNS